MSAASISEAKPLEELLGPLNSAERRHAPPQLWTQGDESLLRLGRRVAVVGTRHPSDLGRRRAACLAKDLVAEGITVVSGLAAGIDTVAHLSAIEAGGRTIAVIGTGLDRAYPAENAELQTRIAAEQLLVSQFPPGMPIQRKNFPQRNRTMALIADVSVIIEASDTSGTLSEGWEALRLGRPLFLLKSLAESKDLAWVTEMRRYGAMVLSELEELLEVLPADHDRSCAIAAF